MSLLTKIKKKNDSNPLFKRGMYFLRRKWGFTSKMSKLDGVVFTDKGCQLIFSKFI